MKLVSVIIPYYKKKKYFSKTINSVLAQTYRNIEIIIVYDDEDISEYKFLLKLKKKHKKISILVNKKNLGAGLSRNAGIKIAKGEYIAFVDADDYWEKNKISKQLTFMKKNKSDISHTSYNIIDEFGKKISYRIAANQNFLKLIKSCDIGLSTVMLKKKLINDKIKFPNLKTKEDFVLWLMLTKKGITIHGINDKLTNWRKTPNSLSFSTYRKLVDGYNVYRRYLKFGFIKSFYFLMILSLNFLKKV